MLAGWSFHGSIVVFDRGHNDYLWFTELTLFNVGFVIRMKENSLYEVIENRTVQGKGVVGDQILAIRTKHPDGAGRSRSLTTPANGTFLVEWCRKRSYWRRPAPLE